MHRAELDELEEPPAPPDPLLHEQHGPGRIELDGQRDESEQRRHQDQGQRDERQAQGARQGQVQAPGAEVLAEDEAAGGHCLDGDLAREPFVDLHAVLHRDPVHAQLEQRLQRHASAPGSQGDDDAVGPDLVHDAEHVLERTQPRTARHRRSRTVVDDAHHSLAKVGAAMDLRDQLLRERSRADHQDPLAVGCRLHEGQDARPQHESEPEGDGPASEQLDRRDRAMAERGVDGRRQQCSGGDGLRQPRHRIAEAPDPAEVVEVVIGGDGNADEGVRPPGRRRATEVRSRRASRGPRRRRLLRP